MKSYYSEGKGLSSFLEKTKKVKEIIEGNLSRKCDCGSLISVLCYSELIDTVRTRAERLFEREPLVVFQIQLSPSEKVLFIRVRNTKNETITLLTVYFPNCAEKV